MLCWCSRYRRWLFRRRMRWILRWRSRRLRRWNLIWRIIIFVHVLIDCGWSPPTAAITWTRRVARSRRGILRIFLNAGYVLYIRHVWFHSFITSLLYIEDNRVFLRILQEILQPDCTSCVQVSDYVVLTVSSFPCQKCDHRDQIIQ